jgi:ion channel-forming bestrophin family protein
MKKIKIDRAKGFLSGMEKNLIFTILMKPDVYFLGLFKSTLYIGAFTLLISYFYVNSEYHETKIPSTMHQVIGIVMGLLLVFRTNTSYDRWWEGRKALAEIYNYCKIFSLKVKHACKDKELKNDLLEHLKLFLFNIISYLKSDSHEKKKAFKQSKMIHLDKIYGILKKGEEENLIPARDMNIIENAISELIRCVGTCDRIKNTPIPLSYSIHIKVSLFIYILTLPFGLFYDLGMWATLLVMLVFYIVAGIEIISSEIEDPFNGDENDLPVDSLIQEVVNSLEKDLK